MLGLSERAFQRRGMGWRGKVSAWEGVTHLLPSVGHDSLHLFWQQRFVGRPTEHSARSRGVPACDQFAGICWHMASHVEAGSDCKTLHCCHWQRASAPFVNLSCWALHLSSTPHFHRPQRAFRLFSAGQTTHKQATRQHLLDRQPAHPSHLSSATCCCSKYHLLPRTTTRSK